MNKLCMRYLASDVYADVIAWLEVQKRIYSASEFHAVELDKEKVHAMCTRRHLLQNTECLANIAVLLCSFAYLHPNHGRFHLLGEVNP